MNEVIYSLCAGTHAHHLIVRLTLRALEFFIVIRRRAISKLPTRCKQPSLQPKHQKRPSAGSSGSRYEGRQVWSCGHVRM